MPLYIKLDFGRDGNIHAWVNHDDISWFKYLSETQGKTAGQCLRALAKKLGHLDNTLVGGSNG